MSAGIIAPTGGSLSQFEFLVRVTRVRQTGSRHAIISAMVVQEDGLPVPRAPNYAVSVPASLTPLGISAGQRWRLTGLPEPFTYETGDGWRVEELRFTATTATLERTSGAHIVALIAGEHFPGIGPVTAQRVWDILGEKVYDALDSADYDVLESAVGQKNARTLIQGWVYYCSSELLQWMQQVALDVRTGRKLLKVYGRSALQRLREDPYRLLALGMSWRAVDTLATSHFEMPPDDPRRLAAAVEAELYEAFEQGDTFTTADGVVRALRRRLDSTLAETAVTIAVRTGIALQFGDRLCAPGPYLLERKVAAFIASRIEASAALFPVAEVDALLDGFELSEQAQSEDPSFRLNPAQRAAVHKAATHDVFCLVGGAGVGKTTALNAITCVLERAELTVYLLAPTGKAAKRMRQATGRAAMTIAGFLRNAAPKGVPEAAVLVVDESSMLDIKLAYQLLMAVPPSVRLILIGDSAQLPPVGPGLTLHELAACDVVPKVELTEGKRFAGNIALTAAAIREGRWRELTSDPSLDVSFISCDDEKLPSVVVGTYLLDPEHSQVLCSTKERGAAPSKLINSMCQQALGANAPRLVVFSDDRQRMEDTGLRLGDPVMCTANLWDHDLQNGSLGHLEEIESPPVVRFNDAGVRIGLVYGWVRWDDGERRPLTDDVLDVLELAYAITVHKSQGSEVPVAIVPVYRTRNLDRTLLYTAITRARRKVILLGDVDIARAAVAAAPHASRRKVMLGATVYSMVMKDV